jgi:hypothetical protein
MTEPPLEPGGLLVLIDPEWQPTEEQQDPPIEVLLGAWLVDSRGRPDRFQPNPVYRPMTPGSPLDPVDAVLRRLAGTGAGSDDLASVLRAATLGIAVDENGVAIVRPAPDGVPSVLVATAFGHRRVDGVPRWVDITVRQLARALPAHGVDVLLNPGATASMRVLADAIRAIATTEES